MNIEQQKYPNIDENDYFSSDRFYSYDLRNINTMMIELEGCVTQKKFNLIILLVRTQN